MIPLAKDTRDAIGQFAEKVENRGLLFRKMVLAKNWGHPARFNDANRFNVLRACTAGHELLTEDAESARRKANGQDTQKHVREAAAYRAKVAGALSGVNVANATLANRQAENALQLLSLIEQSYPNRSHTFVGRLGGRLLIDMAGGVQENAGMSVDRCFGLPMIAGTAVKGCARNAALWDIHESNDATERKRKLRLALLAFGFTAQDVQKGDFLWAVQGDKKLVTETADAIAKGEVFKGILSFLPAYPAEPPVIVADVLTPHPRAAEASRGAGDPRPLFFPAVESGSSFAFALIASWAPAGVDLSEVLQQAGAWLRHAITAQGIGAKTGAGYGWFVIDPQAEEKRRSQMAKLAEETRLAKEKATAAAEAKAAEEMRLASLSPEQLEMKKLSKFSQQEIAEFAKQLTSKSEIEQKAFLALILTPALKEDRKRWKKNKPEIWNPIQETADRLGIPLP